MAVSDSCTKNNRVKVIYFSIGCIFVIFSMFLYSNIFGAESHRENTGPRIMSFANFEGKGGLGSMIPRIIWRTSKFPLNTAPSDIQNSLTQTAYMNPDWVQVYFDDDDVHRFVKKEFPEYLRAFESLLPGAYKADVFRLLVLYLYGGVYNDIGHQYLVPLSEILEVDDEFVASTEDNKQGSFRHAIHNSFLAAPPRSLLVKALMEMVLEDASTCSYGDDPLDLTGPAALGHSFNVWKGTGGSERYGAADAAPQEGGEMPRGTFTVRGMKIKFLSHDAQNHYIKVTEGGKAVIRTKFEGYYEKLYPEQSDSRSAYDSMWRSGKVFDLSKTDCSSTGVAARRPYKDGEKITPHYGRAVT